MALQSASRPSTPSAEIVGNAFVEQYYHILHHSPELVYRFYEESSVLSRPDSNGVMTSVTTMQGINEKILSLNYKDFKAEIKTADAQKSYKDGVLVVATGSLMGKDNMKRKFTQSFFLAPQNNGYFVLNDVFRYVEDSEPLNPNPANEINDSPDAPSTPDPESPHVSDTPTLDPATLLVEDNQIVVEKVHDTLDNESHLADDKVDLVVSQSNLNGNDTSADAESSSSAVPDDAPKKSYASIVSTEKNTFRSQVMKGSAGQNKVYVPTNTLRVAPAKTEKQSPVPVAPPPVPETSGTSSITPNESSNSHDEVEGYSIYIRNLPFNVTVSELEAAFKKFGPIKKGGIQVRSHQHVGHCFGFVEFLSSSSMEEAIQASPVPVGARQAIVEIKKTSSRVDSGRGRFPFGRAGFRNDSFRVRGNFGGGRGYGRNDYSNKNQGEFSGRGRGPGEGYQRGRGRGGHPIRSNQNTD